MIKGTTVCSFQKEDAIPVGQSCLRERDEKERERDEKYINIKWKYIDKVMRR